MVFQEQLRLQSEVEQMLQVFGRLEFQRQQRLLVEEDQMLLEFGRLELQRQHFKQELEYLGGQLREEAVRCERLEEQMNDLTELHQNEMEIIKVRFIMLKSKTDLSSVQSGVTDMEEKVQYQSEERIRDIQVRGGN